MRDDIEKKHDHDLIKGLSDDVVELTVQEELYQKIIVDLETIIKYQNSLIFNLNGTVEAQNYRMWWYTDFINKYDSQLLEIGKVLSKKDKKDIEALVEEVLSCPVRGG